MSYTEQDVERVAEAICAAEFDGDYWASLNDGAANAPDAYAYQREINHLRVLARAALEAMEREPIEDVLRNGADGGMVVRWAGPLGENEYWALVAARDESDREVRFDATGATIDAAIRNAVAAAKGE